MPVLIAENLLLFILSGLSYRVSIAQINLVELAMLPRISEEQLYLKSVVDLLILNFIYII